ncbi:MAG: hypothetical protein ACKVOH_03700 [Chlamydiales bacterium]
MPDPISNNPGIMPIPGSPGQGPVKPEIGGKEEEAPGKKFAMPQEAKPETEGAQGAQTAKPSPMDVAKDSGQPRPQTTPEELSGQLNKLQNNLEQTRAQLNNPDVTKKLSSEHLEALEKLSNKMNPDMRAIAQNSGGQHVNVTRGKNQDVISHVTNWIQGSQKTLNGALEYLANTKKPSIGTYMKLQYSIQRATQRGELFSSILGSTVSGIKTIMSTQLG